MASLIGTPVAQFFSNDASPDLNITIPAGSRRVIVLYGGYFDGSSPLTVNAPTLSGGGGTFSQFLTNGSVTAGLQRIYVLPLDDAITGARTITQTFSSGMDECLLAAAVFEDVDQAAPLANGTSLSLTSGTSTSNLTATLGANELLVGGCYYYGGANRTITPSDTGVVENEPGAADRSGIAMQLSTDGAMNWTFNGSADWMALGARLVHDGGAVSYTLACEAGSFGLTGANAELVYSGVAPVLACDPGTFALTGADASLERGRRLAAEGGSFALTGDDMLADRSLACDGGSFALTGADVTLIDSGGAAVLACGAGAFNMAGADAALAFGRRLAANAGAFALTGAPSGLLLGRRLDAQGGAYALTGADLTLARGRALAADGGAFALIGIDLGLTAARRLDAQGGAYALAGTAADFRSGRTMAADSGSFTYSGAAAALLQGRRLDADAGSFALTGADVGLQYSGTDPVLACAGGAFSFTGADVGFRRTYVMPAAGGAYVLSGAEAGLRKGVQALGCEPGAFSLIGHDVAFPRSYVLVAESGAYVLTGAALSLAWSEAFRSIGGSRRRVGGRIAVAAATRIGGHTARARSNRRIGSEGA